MENMADISEPKVLPNERKLYQFNFASVYSVPMGEKAFLPSKIE